MKLNFRILLRSLLLISIGFTNTQMPAMGAAAQEAQERVAQIEKQAKLAAEKAMKQAERAAAKAAAQPKSISKASTPTKKPTPSKKAPTSKPATTKKAATKDKEISAILSKIKNGKLPTSALGPLADLLRNISRRVMSGDIVNLKAAKLGQLPIEFSSTQAVALTGTITFFNQPVTCTLIIGKLKDATGVSKLGFSLEVGLAKNYKVKDFNFLSTLGVKSSDLGKFGTIDLPQPTVTFSTFEQYTNPTTKALIKAGIVIGTRTKVATLMKLIKTEVNNLTGGKASKLPFLARVNDNAQVAFNVSVGFTGTVFQGFGCNISLPMELGVDIAKLRAEEKRFNPGIKAPFQDLNKPIKAVTGIINEAPLNEIKDISVGNFIAGVGVEANTFKITFGAELNVTTNAGTRYGMLGTVGLTPEQIALELRKSPSIKSMPLGNGVSIENIALATTTNFAVLASTGMPFSGIGMLGEIKFPFEGDSVTIGLAGQADVTGNFMMMGSVQNLDAKKIAVFNAKLIENLARQVKFDTTALTQAMKQMPTIKINDGYVYFSTQQLTLGGRIFPMGFGVNLDVLLDKQKGRLSVAGNQTQLTFLGYLSEIKTPIIVLSGDGLDKKENTADDGPFIDFAVYAAKPLKSRFAMSGEVSLPPVKISGHGDISMSITSMATKFAAQVANLFKADFDFAFDIKNPSAARIAFELSAAERKNFLGLAFKQLENAIKKAQTGAAKIMLEPLRLVTSELAKGFNNLDIGFPKKIAASVIAKTWSGSMQIDGGSIKLPVVGTIKLAIPKISFSLKDPAKAIGAIAEKWANQIVSDMLKMGKDLEKFGKQVAEGAKKAGETIAKGTKTAAEETGKGVKKAGETIAKGAETAVEETGKGVKKAAGAVATTTKKAGKAIEKGVGDIGKAIGGLFSGN